MSKAFVVAFVSQKGGVGKSTLARGLAREAAHGGLNVKIADLDTQQLTSVKWNARRQQAGIEPAIRVESFATAAAALKDAAHYDLLILDGPARFSAATLEIARSADLIVQPSGPSIDDLEPGVLEFNGLMKEGVSRAKLVFALNHIGTEAEERKAREYVSQRYEVLPGCLEERPAFRDAMNKGHTITEIGFSSLRKRADALIQALVDKVANNGGFEGSEAAA